MTPDADGLLELADAVATEAGALLLDYARRFGLRHAAQRRKVEVATKTSATDPVSEADTASERVITDRILEARPDDGILGEEDATNRPGTSGLRWVIDPLDGTVNYLYGIPQWCVSVACEDRDGTVVGVVHDPNRGETFAARRGGGATLGRQEMRVSQVREMSRTLLATGFSYDPDVRVDQGRLAAALVPEVRDVRRAGAAALDLAWVAAGRLDAYLEFALQPWDWIAGRLLVTEAGGVGTTHRLKLGGEVRTGLLACGPRVHDELAAWLVQRGEAA